MSPGAYTYQDAIRDFQSARQKAGIQEVLARLAGKPARLLSYEEVAEKLKLHIRAERGIRQIPLEAIVGSVGRYTDFTRTFLPRRMVDRDRWARVKEAFMDPESTLPPIEVYKVGEAYFVIDGNHRVSIARQEGMLALDAHVIEVRTSVPLTPEVQPDDLIIKAEYAEFLEKTRIMDLRPNVDLSVTIPNQYGKLLEEICAEDCLLDNNSEDRLLEQAVTDWYDNTYLPLAETIRDRGLLRWFPGRTITDLYLWILENRSALEKELGWEIQSDIAAVDSILEPGVQAETGSWRRARTVTRYTANLFADILVPLSGDDDCWDALEQAILIAQREGARLHGLHIVETIEEVESQAARAVRERFNRTCAEAEVVGSLAVEAGTITKKICERAAMTDLVVLKLVHPPAGGLYSLKSQFRALIVNSSRPMLGVPSSASPLKRALLAYDDSPRAREAMFVAAYLAEVWKTGLTVFTAEAGILHRNAVSIQDHARRYLELHEVQAEYIFRGDPPMVALAETVAERKADLVLMGGYGGPFLREVVTGSTLDAFLWVSSVPTFICR